MEACIQKHTRERVFSLHLEAYWGTKTNNIHFSVAHGLTVGIRLKRPFRYFHTLLTFQILKSERNKRIVFGQEEEEEEEDEEDFATK
jgi:hypothetical protein